MRTNLLHAITLAGTVVTAGGQISAQTALPFPPEGEHLFWQYLRTYGISGYHEYVYQGENEELDGQWYKIIRTSFQFTVYYGMGQFDIQEGYHGIHCRIRADSAGVTYVHSTEFPPEEILFDPAIDVGDTVPGTWLLVRRNWPTGTVTVSDIDTLIDNQGTARRAWHFDVPGAIEPFMFIEGLGSNQEFLGLNWIYGGPDTELQCARYDSLSIYGSDCTSITVGVESAPVRGVDPLRVMVVPGTDVYQLNQICTGTVHDGLGRLVLRLSASQEIRMNGMPTGVYTLRTQEHGTVRYVHE